MRYEVPGPRDGAPDPDRYLSLETGDEIESKVKGSRFLGQAFRADSEDEAGRRLAEVRRKYHDASHHVWALRTGPPEDCRERSDDDGEPSRTAGAPILAVLQGSGLHDALVIVTRWFGGTKLGPGGLIRAYSAAARAALETIVGTFGNATGSSTGVARRRPPAGIGCTFSAVA